jgi:hypothetical protein
MSWLDAFLNGTTGPTGPSGPAGTNGSATSWVDLAAANPSLVTHTGGSTVAQTVSNCWWTSQSGLTTSGGRLYWKASGAPPDSVTARLLASDGSTVLGTATLSLSADGLASFVWAGGPVSLSAYKYYFIQVTSAHGGTLLNTTTLTINGDAAWPSCGSAYWFGSTMLAPGGNWIFAGVQQSSTLNGNPVGAGSGSNASIAPVEMTFP